MSNSHLFLKSGFVRAPLQNGVGRYICQLKRLTLKFCKNNGSSKGARDFLENDLMDFARDNPSVVVYVKPRRHRTPVIVAEYLNGERQWMNCRNYTREEIQKWTNLLCTQNGSEESIRLRKMWHISKPSIQGPWTPFTLKHPETNKINYPNKDLSQPLDVEKSASEKLIEMFQKQKLSNDLPEKHVN